MSGLDDRVQDTAGMANFILDNLDEFEREFYEQLVTAVARNSGIPTPVRASMDLIVRKLTVHGIDLRSGGVEDAVLDVITDTSRESDWAKHVDAFVKDRKIVLSFSRRDAVLDALDRLEITPHRDNILLAQVIDEVTRGSGTDPVQLTRPTGRTSPWDFQVDLFETSAAQIVLEENVRAAGALMWCYDIGERLGVYKLTDALVYRWWIGLLDFGDPDLTSEAYRYYKLRDERPAEEERFLLYRRILDVGQAPIAERVVVNEEFPALWRTLMEEVATYIDRTEASFRSGSTCRASTRRSARCSTTSPSGWPAWPSPRSPRCTTSCARPRPAAACSVGSTSSGTQRSWPSSRRDAGATSGPSSSGSPRRSSGSRRTSRPCARPPWKPSAWSTTSRPSGTVRSTTTVRLVHQLGQVVDPGPAAGRRRSPGRRQRCR